MKKKIIIIGPAYPLRGGGLASYNERLCKECIDQGFDAMIYTFSMQYPSILFPGSTQYSAEPRDAYGLNIEAAIHSMNPFNWIKVGRKLRKIKPDIIVVRYWMPFMAPCFGTILRIVKKNKHTKIVCIADNIIPHEKRPADKALTRYFLKPVDKIIVMSEAVSSDVKNIFHRNATKVPHPLYDNFGDKIEKEKARDFLGLDKRDKIILFFGFIREYKGLDLLLKAMSLLSKADVDIKLLVAGEFYVDAKPYTNLIKDLGIEERVILRTDFIPNDEIKYYFSACDFVIQPYRSATQSGVTPLAYHFEKPMLVTNVGGLPDMVPDGIVGLVCEPNAEDIAKTILRQYAADYQSFIQNIRKEKQKYSWDKMVKAIVEE